MLLDICQRKHKKTSYILIHEMKEKYYFNSCNVIKCSVFIVCKVKLEVVELDVKQLESLNCQRFVTG